MKIQKAAPYTYPLYLSCHSCEHNYSSERGMQRVSVSGFLLVFNSGNQVTSYQVQSYDFIVNKTNSLSIYLHVGLMSKAIQLLINLISKARLSTLALRLQQGGHSNPNVVKEMEKSRKLAYKFEDLYNTISPQCLHFVVFHAQVD